MSYGYKAFFGQWFVFDFQLEPVCMCTNERDAAVVCCALNANESPATGAKQRHAAWAEAKPCTCKCGEPS